MELYSPSAQNNLERERQKIKGVTQQDEEEETQSAFLPVSGSLLKLLHATYQLTYNPKT